jgi:hypothetical protein
VRVAVKRKRVEGSLFVCSIHRALATIDTTSTLPKTAAYSGF